MSAKSETRPCTCHPDDNPPTPCPRKYALTDCRIAALERSLAAKEAELAEARARAERLEKALVSIESAHMRHRDWSMSELAEHAVDMARAALSGSSS